MHRACYYLNLLVNKSLGIAPVFLVFKRPDCTDTKKYLLDCSCTQLHTFFMSPSVVLMHKLLFLDAGYAWPLLSKRSQQDGREGHPAFYCSKFLLNIYTGKEWLKTE